MKPVGEVLRYKADSALVSVTPMTTVLEAVMLMAEKGIGSLLVMEGEKMVGILSERDYVRRVALFERSALGTTVGEVMTVDVVTVSPTDGTQYCMQLMTDKRLRHLPVVENGELVGLLSIGDLVKHVIQEQESLIKHLESYIRGE
ncbi:CBS domain-containing protein [Pseudomonas pohangensis]|uniref:CBS domain-containing protein n=1 Tax=Pseudomonas pohangensis TaxID=364197 RepID=A0A1H2DWA1_9PSED|nr:CBS domain-containing protein [Pseudomonas pohangensis]SDT87147.1 CBS domain-containing protein [Pseudomonas pohangensis]